jgi:type VI secretion system protein VasD
VTERSRGVKALPVIDMAGPRGLLTAMLLTIATGCSGPPPPPPPTVVKAEVTAAMNVNLTPDGQGAPVETRVYQLGTKTVFDGAEFFPLYKADTATLGPDFVKKDQFLLIPGGAKTLTLSPPDTVHAIGVFAAYRDFANSKWRASVEIPAHQTTTITITMDNAGIKLDAKSVKP